MSSKEGDPSQERAEKYLSPGDIALMENLEQVSRAHPEPEGVKRERGIGTRVASPEDRPKQMAALRIIAKKGERVA